MTNNNQGASSTQARKKGRPATGRTQKHMAFRCDFENIEYLESKSNKGGFINQLLREARKREGWGQDCADMAPSREDEEK